MTTTPRRTKVVPIHDADGHARVPARAASGGFSGGSGGSGGDGRGPGARVPPTGKAHERRPADLIVPLATLLGLAEQPGEIHGFGLLDPKLARELAAAAAASLRTGCT